MRNKVIQVAPTGWESDPENEYLKLSTLDYCVGQVFVNYALFFKLSDDDKPKTIPVLKRGLEITLSQCRQLCGTLEPHPDGGLAFHKKCESTVEFHVQWLDGPDDEGKHPSFDDLEKRHFVSQALGDINTWCVAPMTYGEKPEAMPKSRPKAPAFKATFIRGGLVFMMHHHHYANDVMGWAGTLHQLAKNCAATWESPENPALPPWDPACLDLSRHHRGTLITKRKPLDLNLRRLHGPDLALLTKHRAKLFNPDPTQPLLWGEAVDLRRRFRDPPVPERAQGNMVGVALSIHMHDAVPPPTVAEVISEAPLSKLAWYIRQLTSSVTEPAPDRRGGE
ncbi:hypothetical protein C8A01DRAFT_39281 [Parachaetomium inaequale]|uniref:Trichothecene 3-O-acetyltransferase-like N-terminal domain-containing protein n=1 Tax=Parachaetomium inaequale TaxID=2588326 RepID=A0AAN6PCG4_9PEZI|nr:hypothetical protein C8A01DRAFT_39281 [Parachaetomium inaequale]